MATHIRKSILIAMVVLAIAVSWLARTIAQQNSDSSGVIYFDHEKIGQAFAKGGTLVGGHSGHAQYRVVTARKDGPTDAESHNLETDVIYVVDGTATVVTGGTLVASRTIAPDEMRAESVRGGDSRTLSKGDVMIIPNGVPHWFKVDHPPFLYFIVKVH